MTLDYSKLNLPPHYKSLNINHNNVKVSRRLLAFALDLFLIDILILSAFNEVFLKLIPVKSVSSAFTLLQSNQALANTLYGIFLLVVLLSFAYFVLCQYMIGQTLGSMIMRFRVIPITRTKSKSKHINQSNPPLLWQCFVRNLFVIPVFPFILLWIADPLYFFLAKKNIRFSEWLSKTIVINT